MRAHLPLIAAGRRRVTGWAAAALLAAAGCKSPEQYRAEADREAYALVQARRAELLGEASPFTIQPPADSLRQRLLRGEAPPGALDLLQCLEIAAENSREYRSERERLYLAALDLTLEQWRFRIQPDAAASATATGGGQGAQDATAEGQLTLRRLLGTGAQVVANIGESFFRVLSTGDGWDALSSVSLSITQPLLRGASREVILEPLTQAQRDLLYAARDYERFRRTFAVDLAGRYFRALQAMDALENERQNAAALEELRRRNEALAAAGRMSDIQVDQARQDELRSRNRLIDLQQNLQLQLDDFKFFLGLPVETQLALDPAEVARHPVAEGGELEATDEDALADHAWGHRLDYLNTRDQVEDAARHARVAADALRAGLDLQASAGGSSLEGRPLGWRPEGVQWSAGFVLDLPIWRVPERNAYMATLVAEYAARRSLEALGDQIRSGVRDGLRRLRSARESYAVQVNAVKLAERRVQSASLNLQAGRSSTRDVLEAQSALLAARNAATAAQIAYILAGLDLYSELELLVVDAEGLRVDNETLARLLQGGG